MPALGLLPDVVAHAEADAPPAQVWARLVDLTGAPAWCPLVARVDGADAAVYGGERVHVVPATPLATRPRWTWRVPVDVALVDDLAELGLVAYPVPGLAARIRVRLLPLPGGRTDCEVRVRLAGVLATASWPATWLAAHASAAALAGTGVWPYLAARFARSTRRAGNAGATP